MKTKKVLLFFSGLDVDNITEYVSILNPIYEKVTSNNEYKIVWIPIVEQWTIEMQKKFELLRSKMSWFVVQNFSSISAIKYVKEQWHYKNEPIIVALNSQGNVEHYNAVHMIKIWGPSAFPFTHRRDEELRKREDWFGSLMIEFSTDISTWVKFSLSLSRALSLSHTHIYSFIYLFNFSFVYNLYTVSIILFMSTFICMFNIHQQEWENL